MRVPVYNRNSRNVYNVEDIPLCCNSPQIQLYLNIYEADRAHSSSAEFKNSGTIPVLRHMSSWHSA
jgi:hypothetical protein